VTKFEDTNAYKLGLIDDQGKKLKKPQTSEEKSAYNAFHRLVFNIKKLLAKVPGGSSRLATYAAALYLIKEKYEVSDNNLEKILEKSGLEVMDLLRENSEWFLLEDKMLSPGVYRVRNDKVVNSTCEELVRSKDKIRVMDGSYPVGEVFGIDVYEAVHIPTNQKIYITVGEIIR
jgi:hypothetical protein